MRGQNIYTNSNQEDTMKKAQGICLILLLFMTPGTLPAYAEWPAISFSAIASGFDRPVRIVNAGDGSGRLFVVEQSGTIRIVKNGSVLPVPFLDISGRLMSGGEQGLLGLAFPPGYASKGHFYVNYTRIADGATVVARYRVTADADIADPASQEVLLVVEQPFPNHNGGNIAFSPADGFLYIGMGDGGSANDPNNFAQNLAPLPGNKRLLGKMLRIDVESGAAPYAIPIDNPPMGGSQSEIWAWGLRNPWGFSFDRATADLYIGDVGQNAWEEINFQRASSSGGRNYGWRILEANDCSTPFVGCVPPKNYSPPVFAYSHARGCSVTGGHVYRAAEFPNLNGVYFFGDFCTGNIWGLRKTDAGWEKHFLADTSFSVSAFGEDEEGNIFVASYGNGIVYKINQSILLTSPNGGEVLHSGASFPVIWQASPDMVSFSLLYSLDNGTTWKTMDRGLPGTSYSWAVPHFLRTKRSVRLKIRGFDAQGTKIGVDRSDAVFTITKF